MVGIEEDREVEVLDIKESKVIETVLVYVRVIVVVFVNSKLGAVDVKELEANSEDDCETLDPEPDDETSPMFVDEETEGAKL